MVLLINYIKNTCRLSLIGLLCLVANHNLQSQNYTRDAGIRLGDHFVASGRQFIEEDRAVEVMLFIGHKGFTVTAMKELFVPALRHLSDRLFFFYGFGAHMGFRNSDHYKIFNRTYKLDQPFSPLLGIDGMTGIEYRFSEYPLAIGVDFRPYFEYSTNQYFGLYLQSIGISAKYRF